ncbi:Hypothetical_protein [Hexamita inflata]|uniref:Hypothetical_protein n=1 Tax=Hexamita inflata TaxID=28002 RepID=A0AA86NVI9_9EUKA|nr:Hypothetical protein HINF_LOCUS14428 [Hexamita inflata]
MNYQKLFQNVDKVYQNIDNTYLNQKFYYDVIQQFAQTLESLEDQMKKNRPLIAPKPKPVAGVSLDQLQLLLAQFTQSTQILAKSMLIFDKDKQQQLISNMLHLDQMKQLKQSRFDKMQAERLNLKQLETQAHAMFEKAKVVSKNQDQYREKAEMLEKQQQQAVVKCNVAEQDYEDLLKEQLTELQNIDTIRVQTIHLVNTQLAQVFQQFVNNLSDQISGFKLIDANESVCKFYEEKKTNLREVLKVKFVKQNGEKGEKEEKRETAEDIQSSNKVLEVEIKEERVEQKEEVQNEQKQTEQKQEIQKEEKQKEEQKEEVEEQEPNKEEVDKEGKAEAEEM